ncbi:arylesterase [Sphingobacterium sp. SGR-19]|uniref:arylesterase n=1 Tax=Sphingobacterium sp. SGR-19 TaxID=2710886 RepID=UPI0013EE2D05|nr:arylesterase [Sphingobacterium sp. SGR-19]NGM66711.1 arylesterase [Sphingobacterium sp. SGR-19]
MIDIVRRYSYLFFGILLFSCNNGTSDTTENKNEKNEQESPAKKETIRNILFFGNSLTAGYGLDDPQEAFPTLIQEKIDSLGLPYHCINAGLSGETSAGGKERIDWLLQQPVDIFVLELGANDGLRGVSTASTYENLSDIVEKVLKANPDCKLVLAGMKVPPSMGQEYFNEFEALFPRLAKQYDMALVPFLLDNVAGIGDLNQADAVHPTAEGQKILAHNVWAVLEPLL